VVMPLRLWVLPYTVHSVTVNAATVLLESLRQDFYAPGVVIGYYDQSNVQINGIPYYRQNLFEELRQQFNPDTGSSISYVLWRNSKRYLVYDLSRISDRLQSATEPVALTYVAIRADNIPAPTLLQTYYLIERQDQITMRFTSADVAIVVGNLD
jgi:hypothetical protein